MNVLVIGGGGREHAIIWKLSQSPKIKEIFCAPGNAGISNMAKIIPIGVLDIEGVINFSKENFIDLVVVAPDDPLAAGMVDELEKAGIRAFGPYKNAAIIESSKAFSKDLMKKYNIPTAGYETFDKSEDALDYLEKVKYPIVIKADGLALGKGVFITNTYIEAKDAIESIMNKKSFGNSGDRVVIEEFLEGIEVSVLAFTDGKTVVPMVSSQDHKKIFDGDMGPNTGGMGTFSPSRVYNNDMEKHCMEKIYIPTIEAMNKEGRKFKGVLYFGLIITKDGIKVLEYNARFGDPETQVVLPRLETDLLDIFEAIIDENLSNIDIKWNSKECVCVIMASGGYPDKYETNFEIKGLDEAASLDGVIVFHAGTKMDNNVNFTNGGRVLGVTGLDNTLEKAAQKAYNGVSKIQFKNMYFRKDIASI